MLYKCIYTVKKRNWQGLEEGILSYHQAPCIKICFWIFLLLFCFCFYLIIVCYCNGKKKISLLDKSDLIVFLKGGLMMLSV